MAKWVNSDVLDAALDYIRTNTDRITVCATQPTTFLEATDTNMLAVKTGLTTSDFEAITDGSGSDGRMLEVKEQAQIPIDSTGDADHVALCSSDALLYVTTADTQNITAGNTVTIPAWTITLRDPSS